MLQPSTDTSNGYGWQLIKNLPLISLTKLDYTISSGYKFFLYRNDEGCSYVIQYGHYLYKQVLLSKLSFIR